MGTTAREEAVQEAAALRRELSSRHHTIAQLEAEKVSLEHDVATAMATNEENVNTLEKTIHDLTEKLSRLTTSLMALQAESQRRGEELEDIRREKESLIGIAMQAQVRRSACCRWWGGGGGVMVVVAVVCW